MAKFDTTTPDGIRDASIDRFTQLAFNKYNVGQEEHGGVLSRTVTLNEMEDECIDLWHYCFAYRLKAERLDEEYEREIRRLKEQLEMLKHEIFRLENREGDKEVEEGRPDSPDNLSDSGIPGAGG